MRDTTRGGMGVSRSNHNVRLRVLGSELGTNTLNQLITQRLPTRQSIQNDNEVTLAGSPIHSNKSTSILTSMHAAPLLRRVTVTHETYLSRLTGDISCTGTHQVGRGLRCLGRRRGHGHLPRGQDCGGGNEAGRTNTCQ